ncbi:hypothetical protein STEG23_015662, partial [Scotinomys teguina]
MSDEIFSTTLAYTKSPKATKRTSFQDELIRAITARSARQRSSEYSDDFDSDEIELGASHNSADLISLPAPAVLKQMAAITLDFGYDTWVLLELVEKCVLTDAPSPAAPPGGQLKQ